MPEHVRGLDRLLRKLDKVGGVRVFVPPMQRSVLRLQRPLQTYPPQPSGSKYKRTGTLGRKWTVRVTTTANSITGKVGNNTRYGPFVQSERFQTRIHRRTGWLTDRRAVQQEERAILADFQQATDRALGE